MLSREVSHTETVTQRRARDPWLPQAWNNYCLWIAIVGWLISSAQAQAAAPKACPLLCQDKKVCSKRIRCYTKRFCYPAQRCSLEVQCKQGQTKSCPRHKVCRTYSRCDYKRFCRPFSQCYLVPHCRKRCRGARHRTAKKHSTSAQRCQLSPLEARAFQRINQERRSYGIDALRCHPRLLLAARRWSSTQCLQGRLSHRRLLERFQRTGLSYRYIAENVAAGQRKAVQLLRSWRQSQTHRTNLLNPRYTHTGLGLYRCKDAYGYYWTQMFAKLTPLTKRPARKK